VTLGIWQATGAQDLCGKIFGVYFPVLAFVAIGFDHVIANMFLVRHPCPAHRLEPEFSSLHYECFKTEHSFPAVVISDGLWYVTGFCKACARRATWHSLAKCWNGFPTTRALQLLGVMPQKPFNSSWWQARRSAQCVRAPQGKALWNRGA
jgi:hypothetical protein